MKFIWHSRSQFHVTLERTNNNCRNLENATENLSACAFSSKWQKILKYLIN